MLPVTDAIVNELNQQFNKTEKQSKYTIRKDLSNFASLSNRSPNRSPKSVFRYDFSNSNQDSTHSISNSLSSSIDTTGMQLAVVLTGSTNRLSNRTSTEFKSVIIDEDNQFEENINALKKTIAPKSMTKSQKALRLAFFFSLAYSANIGGTGTLTASNPNLILQAFMEKTYPDSKVMIDGNLLDIYSVLPRPSQRHCIMESIVLTRVNRKIDFSFLSKVLSFATWLIYALPCALIMLMLAWLFVLTYFLRDLRPKLSQTRHLEECLISKYEKLGPIKFREVGVLIFFVLIVL